MATTRPTLRDALNTINRYASFLREERAESPTPEDIAAAVPVVLEYRFRTSQFAPAWQRSFKVALKTIEIMGLDADL